jgi:hypothetical protein
MQQLEYRSILPSSTSSSWSKVLINTDHTILCSLAIVGESAMVMGEQLSAKLQTWQAASALEFHQLLQSLVAEVTTKNHQLFLATGCFLDGKCFLASYQGSVILRRHQKAGTLVSSAAELQLIEGRTQPSDLFIFATQTGEELLQKFWQPLNQGLSVPDLEDLIARETPLDSASTTTVLGFLTEIKSVGSVSNSEKSADVTKASLSENQPKVPVLPWFQLSHLLASLKKKLITFQFWLNQQRQLYFSDDIYLRKQNTKKIVRILLPVGVVLLLLAGGGFVRHSQLSGQVKAAQQTVQPFMERLNQLKQDKDHPLETRTKAQQLVTELQDVAQKFANQPAANKTVQATLSDAQSFYQSISGQEEYPALPVFFDFRPVQSDFVVSSADLENQIAVFLDKGQKKMIALNLETKQPSAVPLASDLTPAAFSFDGRNVTLLSNGVVQFPLTESTKTKKLRENEDANAAATFLADYDQYLYVLNPEKRNIFRYLAASGSATFSDPAGWVRPGTQIDFENLQSMAIDGNIWLSTKTGQIQKLLSGKPDEFTITGLKDPFTTPVTLYTKDGVDNLYVLDPQKSRLVVLTKKGEFLKEVKSQSLASATTLIVNEKMKKAFAVSGSLVFEVGL